LRKAIRRKHEKKKRHKLPSHFDTLALLDWVAMLNKDRLFSFQAAIWRIISSDTVKIVLLLGRFVLETISKEVFLFP
jgi:hypothetical protein